MPFTSGRGIIRMRILMLNNEFPPFGGGTATVNLMLLREFAQMGGTAVDLVTTGPNPGIEEFAPGIKIHRLPSRQRNPHHAEGRDLLAYASRAVPYSLRLHRARPYAVCIAWSAVPAGAVALALRARCRLPYLVRIGGSDIPGHEARYRWAYLVLTPVIRQIWRHAERNIVKCRVETEEVRRVDARVPLAVIPNGVDLSAFIPAVAELAPGPFRFVIVARLIEHKGHRLLFSALRQLVAEGLDVALDVVGSGDSEPAFKAHVRELGLDARVNFTGAVPRELVATFYRTAQAFVLPSHAEGMSVSTLEAMASGLPLIITRTGGTEELLAEGQNGYSFAVGDEAALTEHMRRLARDPAHARALGAASRQRAETFSWSNAAKAFLELAQSADRTTRGTTH